MKITYVCTTTLLSGLLLALASLNVQATIRGDGKRGTVANSATNSALPSRAAGKIDSIDLGANTMIISGTGYLFLASTTKVYGVANAPGNPLGLKPGMAIQFKTVQEPGSARPRITEIWTSGITGEKK